MLYVTDEVVATKTDAYSKRLLSKKLTFFQSGSQWEIYEKSTKIRRLHGTVTCVLHAQFT